MLSKHKSALSKYSMWSLYELTSFYAKVNSTIASGGMMISALAIIASLDYVTLQVNEAYPRREKMMITQQNEAYGVHSHDQTTIAITPNEV